MKDVNWVRNQMNRVQLANQLPLNRIAAKWLAQIYPESSCQSELAVLSLMRWGLDSQVVQIKPLAAHHPDCDQMMWQITRMGNWEPRNVMAFLTNPEEDEGGTVLAPEQLAAEPTAEDAAQLLLECLYDAMVVTLPTY